tara:strand:+ start:10322 stop:11089 length:768 start_codon:yes stop_codon:yes gene_type:complete
MATKEKKAPKTGWEIKDRVYYLQGSTKPIVFTIPAMHTTKRALLWFDEEKGYQRELRYATNQKSVFVDEQEGPATMEHVIFRNGSLFVPKQKQALQKLLSLYHPYKDTLYYEFDSVKEAVDDLEYIEYELQALNLAAQMEVDQAEAILRVEYGSKVNQMTSREIKRDLILFAKRNPGLMIELANDENVEIRNFGIKAVEANILKLAPDQRTFNWASNGRKVMTVPFDENPYSALAAFFKTDDGIEIYQNIEKRLK